jgi:hypothetical protein
MSWRLSSPRTTFNCEGLPQPEGPHLWPNRRMQIGYNPGPKEVPLARRRGGAGLGGWVGGPASTAGHNGEAGPPQSRSEPDGVSRIMVRLEALRLIYGKQSGSWHRKRLRPWRKPDPGPPGSSSWSQSGKPRAMPACRRGLATAKGGTRRKTSRRTTSFGPTDIFVGIICARTRQKRSLVANGFD